MKTLSRLLIGTLIFGALSAAAIASDDAKETVQDFYDGYMKVIAGDHSQEYVLGSDAVTKPFKKAYKAYMKEPEADPIICGQDYPDAGYKVSKVVEEGETATVTMTSRDASFDNTFKVKLVKADDDWQIADINNFLKQ